MGFLNNNTITVDAIITKHGRKKLSEGKPLGPVKFALSDDGIDYTLFNPDHANGSAFYAEAITDLPQLEAVPDDGHLMNYTLMSKDRNTIFLPLITGLQDTFTLENQNSKQKISPNTENGDDASYQFIFQDVSAVNVTGGTRKDISGTNRTFLSRAEIATAAIFTGAEITITAKPTDTTRKLTMQIVGVQTGATKYVNVVVNNNIRIKPIV